MADVTRRKYLNSPLIEVLCEINFKGAKSGSTIPGYFHKKIEHLYPHVQEGRRIFVENNEENASPKFTSEDSTRFLSEDGKQVIQLSRDVLTINSLKGGYSTFEAYLKVIGDAVAAYIEIAKPTEFERLRLRYINLLSIESEEDRLSLEDYFNCYPNFPLVEDAYSYEMQFQVAPFNKKHQLFAKITSNAVKEDDEAFTFAIDINNLYIHNNEPDINAILKIASDAHENIGRLFESIITERTRNLFKEVDYDSCTW